VTRRLVWFGLLVCAAAVLALVLPLGFAAQDEARSEAVASAQVRAQETAVLVAGVATGSVAAAAAAAPPGPGSLTVVLPDGDTVGDDPGPGTEPAVTTARTGRAVSVAVGSDVVVASPAVGSEGTAVVLVRLGASDLRVGLGESLAALAAAGIVLLAASGATAVYLARRTAEPITEVAEVAHRLADGDLQARATVSGVPETVAVGQALNRLAGRVQELLEEERRASADLAHQLRTPLTALAVDLDGVADPDVRARLDDDLSTLQEAVDEIIRGARRPSREGLLARCDAVGVVGARAAFWRVLAEDQRRDFGVTLAAGPLPVRLAHEDLETAVDVVLQNVFVHTPEGTALRLSVSPRTDGPGALLVVEDEGPGWASESARRTGTTGLGLDIVARTAEASGGRFLRERSATGGARAVLVLGGPTEA